MAFCKNCGSNINNEDKYCHSCGYNQFRNENTKNINNKNKVIKEIIYIILIVLAFIIVVYGGRYITNIGSIKVKSQVTSNENKGKVADLEIVDSNQMGNTASNINNGGIAVSQRDTIYYSNWSDDGSIYKMDKSGKNSKLIQDKRCSYLNIIGTWIYYLGHSDDKYKIYMSKIDGTQSNSLDVIVDSKDPNNHLTLLISKGNWLYYATNYAIYRIKSDGSENKKIIELPQSNNGYTTRVSYLNIIGDTIYYHDNSENNVISAVDINTGKRKIVFNGPNFYLLAISDDWIYYVTDFQLTKVKIDGSSSTVILNGNKLSPICSGGLNITDQWIYYSGKDRALCRVKIDGSENMQVNSQRCFDGIDIAGGWYFYGDPPKLIIGQLPN